MKIFLLNLRKKIDSLLPEANCILILALVSGLPLIYSFGRINLGYDTFLPLIPENSFKLAYQWTDRANGIYTLNVYVVWLFILNSLQKLGLNLYNSSTVLQFGIFFLSGLGIFRTFKLLNKGRVVYSLIPAVFFVYSPFMLDYMLYQTGIVGIVWSIYFFLKFIIRKIFTFTDIVWLSICFLIINDLPNPKYHFMLIIAFFLMVLISIIVKLLSWQDIRRNTVKLFALFILSLHLILPFLIFGFSFSQHSTTTINTRKNYEATGETLDYGVAQIHKMIRLFHTPNLNAEFIDRINLPFFFLSYYVLPILVLGVFPIILLRHSQKEQKLHIVIYFMALFYIFLSKGANPPFGLMYELLLRSQLFSFMRTTAGFVVFAAVFYSLILGIVFQYFIRISRYKISSIILVFILLITWGYHLWSGIFFLNHKGVYIDDTKHGIKVPKEYFEAAKSLDGTELDAKIDIYPAQEGYQLNTWGYYGFILYDWLLKQPAISFDKNTIEGQIKSSVNVKFILHDKSAVSNEFAPISFGSYNKVFTSKIIDIYEIPDINYIPHIFIPAQNYFTDKIPVSYLQKTTDRSVLAAYFSLSNNPKTLLSIPDQHRDNTDIEYKKVDPTKYRVRVRNVKSSFPLVFLENYHPLWKIYHVKYRADTIRTDRFFYKHHSGTIQNNNLQNGPLLETAFTKEISDVHLRVNRYFNSWLINPQDLCRRNTAYCTRNVDGTYNIDFVIEFWPQQIVYIGSIISASALFLTLLINMFRYIYNKLR